MRIALLLLLIAATSSGVGAQVDAVADIDAEGFCDRVDAAAVERDLSRRFADEFPDARMLSDDGYSCECNQGALSFVCDVKFVPPENDDVNVTLEVRATFDDGLSLTSVRTCTMTTGTPGQKFCVDLQHCDGGQVCGCSVDGCGTCEICANESTADQPVLAVTDCDEEEYEFLRFFATSSCEEGIHPLMLLDQSFFPNLNGAATSSSSRRLRVNVRIFGMAIMVAWIAA